MKRFETVPKIHCAKKNDWLNKDKVYLACIVAAAKSNEQPRIAFAELSPVSQKLRKDDLLGKRDHHKSKEEKDDYSATFEPLVSLELCQLFRGSCATQFG